MENLKAFGRLFKRCQRSRNGAAGAGVVGCARLTMFHVNPSARCAADASSRFTWIMSLTRQPERRGATGGEGAPAP